MLDEDLRGSVANTPRAGVDFVRLVLGEIEPRDYACRMSYAAPPAAVPPRQMRVGENAVRWALVGSAIGAIATAAAVVAHLQGATIALAVSVAAALASGAAVFIILMRSAAAVELLTARAAQKRLQAAHDRDQAMLTLLLDAQMVLRECLAGPVPVARAELSRKLLDAAHEALRTYRHRRLSLILRANADDQEPRVLHVAGVYVQAEGTLAPDWRAPFEYTCRGQDLELLVASELGLDSQERLFVEHLAATVAILLRPTSGAPATGERNRRRSWLRRGTRHRGRSAAANSALDC